LSDITLTHRLILPVDTNHHGTLYAGSLVRIALESAYATAFRAIGQDATLLLRRVLSIECYKPVPQGSFVEIRGTILHATRAYLVTGLIGVALPGTNGPWMDGLLASRKSTTTFERRNFRAILKSARHRQSGRSFTSG